MVVVKRQTKKKACKKGAKEKNPQTRVRTSGEKNAPFLVSPNLHRAGSGERRQKPIKRGSQDRLRPLCGVKPPSQLGDGFFFF